MYRDELQAIGRDVVYSMRFFVQDPDEPVSLTRRAILERKIGQKVEEMKDKVNLTDGTNAMRKYHVDSREARR